MKILVVFGAILLLAFHKVNAQPTALYEAGSFSKDVANITNEMLASQKDPNNMVKLACKIAGFIQASQIHQIDFQIYGSIYNTLNKLAYIASDMTTPERVLKIIARMQNNFDGQFDELNIQRDVDEIHLPSKINELIDEFINRYSETVVELFDNMYTQSKHLEDESEKLAANSITLMDSLTEKVEKCLEIPQTEFKDTFQCREDTRTMLPGLAHDSALIEVIANELRSLPWLKMDGKTSEIELEWEIRSEKRDLMEKISAEREKREAAKEEQKPAESAEESSEEKF